MLAHLATIQLLYLFKCHIIYGILDKGQLLCSRVYKTNCFVQINQLYASYLMLSFPSMQTTMQAPTLKLFSWHPLKAWPRVINPASYFYGLYIKNLFFFQSSYFNVYISPHTWLEQILGMCLSTSNQRPSLIDGVFHLQLFYEALEVNSEFHWSQTNMSWELMVIKTRAMLCFVVQQRSTMKRREENVNVVYLMVIVIEYFPASTLGEKSLNSRNLRP